MPISRTPRQTIEAILANLDYAAHASDTAATGKLGKDATWGQACAEAYRAAATLIRTEAASLLTPPEAQS